MTFNFNYDKNFTSNYVDKQIEESPFVSMLNIGYKAVVYTKLVFQNYPELFGEEGSSIFYIENAGKTIKRELLYLGFENLLTNSSTNLVKAALNGIPLYTMTQDNIIQWARYLKATEMFTKFEPILQTCNDCLKTFINGGKKFNYKGYVLDLYKVKPLCVTNIGENIAELMIYIAYIYNFLINCKPFVFNEVVTGSSAQLFMEAINNHFNVYYTKLINEAVYVNRNSETVSNNFKFNSLDQLFADVNNINYFTKKDLKAIFKKMLDFESIMDIRDRVLSRTDELLNISMNNQNTITMKNCYSDYCSTLSALFDVVVKNNLWYKNIFQSLPRFNENNINYHELALMTEFALSGGKHPFIINELEQNEACGDPGSLFKYPGLGLQKINTKINKPNIVSIKPFSSSNVFLEIITGFISQLLEEYQTNIFEHQPIKVDEKDLDLKQNNKSNVSIEQLLENIYINGKFGLYSESISAALNYLLSNKQFLEDWRSIFRLSNICELIYDNKFASKMLPSYILSYFPEYLNKFMHDNRNNRLDKFDYIAYFALHHEKVKQVRVNKIHDVLMGLLFLYNDNYINFVNKNVSKITKILTLDSHIIQPYMKAVTDKIDMYCIGGVSLGMKEIDTNPLVRGYNFVVSTQGNSENINDFYKFVKNIPQGEIYDLLTNAINDKNDVYLKQLLASAYNKMFETGNIPPTLSEFDIDQVKGTYSRKSRNYYTELNTSNNIPVYKLCSNYSFPCISASHEQLPSFNSRKISIDKSVSRPLENIIRFDNVDYPCNSTDRGVEYIIPSYEFSTMFKTVNLSFIQPNGYKLMQIYTPNGELNKNNLYFIFTKNSMIDTEDKQPRFNVYDSMQDNNNSVSTNCSNVFTTNLSTPEVSIKRLNNVPYTPNDTFKTHRMKLNGIDKQPIANVKSYL